MIRLMGNLRIVNGILQELVNVNACDKPGCLVYHRPKFEWRDVPRIDLPSKDSEHG